MAQQKHKRPPTLVLCQIPHEVVNDTLGMEIEPGRVVLSPGAQVHARNRHPEDYEICLPYIAGIVADPLYLGDDFKNPGKIEFVGRAVVLGVNILVAVNLTATEGGDYHVTSFYPLSDKKVNDRREKNRLHVAQKKKPATAPASRRF